jgi:hypothetical protein
MADEPVLLAGGNPRIANGEGRSVVESFVAAMPGWKGEVGARLDAAILSVIPDARMWVKWNTPFYGVVGEWDGWIVSYHCLTKYVKVAFQHGALLDPPPPIASKTGDVRYWHVVEDDEVGDRFIDWIRQAAAL